MYADDLFFINKTMKARRKNAMSEKIQLRVNV